MIKKGILILVFIVSSFSLVFSANTYKKNNTDAAGFSKSVKDSNIVQNTGRDGFSLDSGNKNRPSVAVVLAGGGAKGITHIALLEDLEKRGIPVDCVLGTSIGALIGGLYGAGYTPKEIKDIVLDNNLMELFTEIESDGYKELKEPFQYTGTGLSVSVEDGIASLNGLIDDYKIMNFFYKYLGNVPKDIDFDDLPVRFRCVAMDAINGKAKVFESGSLVDSMRASMSIPFVFSPKAVGDSLYFDGGMVDNMPINLARDMGYDIVIAQNVSGQIVVTANTYKSLTGVFSGLTRLIIDNTMTPQIPNADIVLTPDMRGYGTMSFDKVDEILQKGYEEIDNRRAELDKIASVFTEEQKEYLDPNRKGAYFSAFKELDVSEQISTSKSREQKAYSKSRFSIGFHNPMNFSVDLDEDNSDKFTYNPTFDINLFLRHVKGSKNDINIKASVGKIISLKPELLLQLYEGKRYSMYLDALTDLNFGTQTYITDRDSFVTYNKIETKLGGGIGIKFTDERLVNVNFRVLADYYNTKVPLFAKDASSFLNSHSYFYPKIEILQVANDVLDAKIAGSDGLRFDMHAAFGLIKEKFTYKFALGLSDEIFIKDEKHSFGFDVKAATSREPVQFRTSYYMYGGSRGIPGYGVDAYYSDFIMAGVNYTMPVRVSKLDLYLKFIVRGGVRGEYSYYNIENGNNTDFFRNNDMAESMIPFYTSFNTPEWDLGAAIALGHKSNIGDFQVGIGFNNHLQLAVFFNIQ